MHGIGTGWPGSMTTEENQLAVAQAVVQNL